MTHDGAPWVPHPAMPPQGELFAGRWRALRAVSLGIFIIALDIAVVGSETIRLIDQQGVGAVGPFIRSLRP